LTTTPKIEKSKKKQNKRSESHRLTQKPELGIGIVSVGLRIKLQSLSKSDNWGVILTGCFEVYFEDVKLRMTKSS
jgi:hypothetical protein